MSSKKPVAYENPLIPNARLRQMYRAILRAHLLGQALPPAQHRLTAAREAALVSTALDLTARDFVLDAFTTPVLDFLRSTPLHRTFTQSSNDRVPHPSSARVGSRNIRVDAGSPSRLLSPSDPIARIHAALGAAAALQATAALAKNAAKEPDSAEPGSARNSAVVLSISISGELPADTWKPALAHTAQHDLPVIFLVLPSAASKTSRSTQESDLRTIAHRAGVPAIPVDAVDPVALYRVAQESIGHARIGGGPALIQCIGFPTYRTSQRRGSRAPANPVIANLEDYILSRNIATRAWLDREAVSFATQLRSLKTASK